MINPKFNIGDIVYNKRTLECDNISSWLNRPHIINGVILKDDEYVYSIGEFFDYYIKELDLVIKDKALLLHKQYIKGLLETKGQELIDLQDYYFKLNKYL